MGKEKRTARSGGVLPERAVLFSLPIACFHQ